MFWVGDIHFSTAQSSNQLCWTLVANQKQNSKSWITIYQSDTELRHSHADVVSDEEAWEQNK
jgi:hypothetical protein